MAASCSTAAVARGDAGGAGVCVCVCSCPHRAPPHFTDMPGTVRRPMWCPTERNYLQHYTIQLIKLSDEVVFIRVDS